MSGPCSFSPSLIPYTLLKKSQSQGGESWFFSEKVSRFSLRFLGRWDENTGCPLRFLAFLQSQLHIAQGQYSLCDFPQYSGARWTHKYSDLTWGSLNWACLQISNVTVQGLQLHTFHQCDRVTLQIQFGLADTSSKHNTHVKKLHRKMPSNDVSLTTHPEIRPSSLSLCRFWRCFSPCSGREGESWNRDSVEIYIQLWKCMLWLPWKENHPHNSLSM